MWERPCFWLLTLKNNLFLISSDPNNELSPSAHWDHVSSAEIEYLHINTMSDVMETRLLRERWEFWDRLPLMAKSEDTANLEEAEISISTPEPLSEVEDSVTVEKDEL